MSASAPLFMYRGDCVRMPCAVGEQSPSPTFIDINSWLEDGEPRRESIEELDERVDGEACVPSRFSAWASRLVWVALASLALATNVCE